MKTFEALIFDLGKVVFDLSFDRIFQFWATATGQEVDSIKSRFQFDELFDEFERGNVSDAVFRTEISRRLALRLSDQAFDEGWCSLYLDAYKGINELLADLKTQYRLVALTNTNSIHAHVWRIKYRESLNYFDKVFCSHELRVRKPELPAYQRVLDYLGTELQHAIFLDDSHANVAAAAQHGIQTVLVESPSQMQADLNRLLYP